jgi:hypothetical protein
MQTSADSFPTMHVLKKLLAGLGVLLLAVIALSALLGGGSVRFKSQQEPFVRNFLTDLSRHWVLAEVQDRLASEFVEQAGTAQGQRLLREFRQLGPIRTIRDVELHTYAVNPKAQTGVFSLKATFANGEAEVSVTVVRRERATRVLSLYMTGRRLLEPLPAKTQA